MKRLLYLIGWPFRGLWRALRSLWQVLSQAFTRLLEPLRAFLFDEPEDVPLVDSLDKVSRSPYATIPHLEAMRKGILRSALVVLLASLGALVFLPELYALILRPMGALSDQALRISGPGEMLDLLPRIALSAGLFLSIPYFAFETWLFVAPGLSRTARWLTLLFGLLALVLFAVGAVVGYLYVLPYSLERMFVLTGQYGMYDWEMVKYLSYAIKLLFLTELVLFSPLLVLLLLALTPPAYHLNPRLLALFSFLAAALITPGTMLLLDIGLSILLALVYLLNYALLRSLLRRARQAAGV